MFTLLTKGTPFIKVYKNNCFIGNFSEKEYVLFYFETYYPHYFNAAQECLRKLDLEKIQTIKF